MPLPRYYWHEPSGMAQWEAPSKESAALSLTLSLARTLTLSLARTLTLALALALALTRRAWASEWRARPSRAG